MFIISHYLNKKNITTDVILAFNLAQETTVQWVVQDVQGRIIHENTGAFAVGAQFIHLSETAFRVPGLYFVTVKAGHQQGVCKVVKI